MRNPFPLTFAVGVGVALLVGLVPTAPPEEPTLTDPAELIKRPEFVGQTVTVDDRVDGPPRFTQGQSFNELRLKRASGLVVRLPRNLAFERPRPIDAVRVRGILRREGRGLVLDATDLEIFPSDVRRVEDAARRLAPLDAEGRRTWAGWAKQRAQTFSDDALDRLAGELQGQALRIDAERPGRRSAEEWIGLAERGRQEGVSGSVPKALAHRGFRQLLDQYQTAEELETLLKRVEEFFPDARKPAPADPAAWLPRYQSDPYATYLDLDSSPTYQVAFDRKLLADVLQKALERRAEEAPERGVALADEARNRLPDRPGVARRLEERGIKAAQSDIGRLPLAQVRDLARRQEAQGQSDEARAISLRWLQSRREQLGERDAEGRVELAAHYRNLIQDNTSAAELLQAALEIEPGYARAADTLRRMGYRKVGDSWVSSKDGGGTPNNPPAPGRLSDSLLELTREQVRSRLGGDPERVVRSASQGQFIEQWIYQGPRGTQYINFLQPAGRGQARVVGYYSLP